MIGQRIPVERDGVSEDGRGSDVGRNQDHSIGDEEGG
jgi:hypothetical protein